MKNILLAFIALLTFAPHENTHAQAFPSKPGRILVGVSAGGGVDVASRVIAAKLTEYWGQQVVVDNRVGGGQIIATEIVAKAAPDGYTLLSCNIGTHGAGPSLFSKLPYDHIKDFAPISLMGTNPMVLVVNPGVPAKSVKEFIAHANANPGKIVVAYGGIGTSTHMATEMFRLTSGINVVLVPYKGGAAALVDVLGGHVQSMIDGLSTQMTSIKSSRVRALAVTSAKRSAYLPDTPTMIESGVTMEATAWYGLCAPAGVSKPILARINADVVKALGTPDVRQRFADIGLDAEPQTPEQFAALIKSETVKWAKVIKDARIPQQ